ncbi:alpha/beta hydrolase [Haloferula helveola]|uniref:Alpha/beta hydrolase n=1 Tax=Haloferula helveola TaxID=490095 RepID=A0ABN6GYY4_9BACT|nr:alpha/beta hydrolase [Haloferula helveola]
MAKKRLHPLLRLLRGIAIIWCALAVFSCTMADKLIFFPPRPGYVADAEGIVSFDTTKDETIRALHFPASPGQPTVLYSHGNAEDIGGSIDLYQEWRRRGWGVLAYDYPGYGHSTGSPTESSCERAIDAAWNYLTEDQQVAGKDIVIVGRSVGGGPSVWLASKQDPRALVLISPFTSTFAVRPPANYILPGNRFPNLKRVRRMDTPLLVIHGLRDGVIPTDHGRQLATASPATFKRFTGIERAGHNDLFAIAGRRVFDEIESFVAEIPAP